MSRKISNMGNEIDLYISSYIDRELVQSPDEAGIDPQLSSIIVKICERVDEKPRGTILDIGCGHGVLLKRLSELPQFLEKKDWVYVAIDTDNNLDSIGRLARKVGMARRVEPLSLEDFYQKWPESSAPHLVFCRNVLHELSIIETSQLIGHVSRNLSDSDEFIIQDMLRFKKGERHHACWLASKLSSCLQDHGFRKVNFINQGSQSGNAWFNLIAKERTGLVPAPQESQLSVISARQQQLALWIALNKEHEKGLPNRGELITALDIDLQLASLVRALHNVGSINSIIDENIAKRVRISELFSRIDNFVKNGNLKKSIINGSSHFRERGEQLTAMEAFLRSQDRIALVYGGRGTGKSTFINHLLSSRLYDKHFINIDCRGSRGFWPFVEQILAQSGLNLAVDEISVMGDISAASVIPSIAQFANKYSSSLIIAIENIDEFIDTNCRMSDCDLGALLQMLCAKPGIKIIFSSKSEFLPKEILDAGCRGLLPKVRMGRYGTDDTVSNVLDDYFDRGRAGLDRYPDNLIESIDRHPLITALVGQILKKHGPGLLLNKQFISEVRQRLRLDLFSRLVDDGTLPAMEVATKLRIPVPIPMLEKIIPVESLHRARANDLLYSIQDRRWLELIASLGLFKVRNVDDLMPASLSDADKNDSFYHGIISDAYYHIYKADDDPKWIREYHFHRMLSGAISQSDISGYFGKYYINELISSARYCFRVKKDFREALILYGIAVLHIELNEESLMWRASCMIRTNDIQNGENEYRKITAIYPNNIGMKTSHVDALLYIHNYQGSIDALKMYGLQPGMSDWISQQWGRAYLGLHQYDNAIEIFSNLLSTGRSDPYWYIYLARALQQFGDVKSAIDVLRRGHAVYPENYSILTSLAADLERCKNDEEAKVILEALFNHMPSNTRAALSIIKILLRSGDVGSAIKILNRARRYSGDAMRTFLVNAEAEILIYQGNLTVAIDFLRQEFSDDDTLIGLKMEAYIQLIQSASNADERSKVVSDAATLSIPDRWRKNVPVLITRARLACVSRDEDMFLSILKDLESTRIDKDELSRIRLSWERG